MKTSLKENFIKTENMNDALFYNSLIEELNEIIESELSKSYEDVNAEIIDECDAFLIYRQDPAFELLLSEFLSIYTGDTPVIYAYQ